MAKASIRRFCLPMQRRSWIHLETGRGKKMFESCKIPSIFENTYKKTLFEREKTAALLGSYKFQWIDQQTPAVGIGKYEGRIGKTDQQTTNCS